MIFHQLLSNEHHIKAHLSMSGELLEKYFIYREKRDF